MKITTIKKLQQNFIGKICTILTHPVAKRDFNDRQFADFFTGVVDEIEEDGIMTRHTLTGCKNFYFFENIIGIMEEQVLNEDNPEHQKIIQQVKEKNQGFKQQQSTQNPPKSQQSMQDEFIDINDLAELQAKLKKGQT